MKIIAKILIIILCSIIFSIFIRGFFPYESEDYNSVKMIYGDAKKPFVYRTFLPSLTRFTVNLIPGEIRKTVLEKLPMTKINSLLVAKKMDCKFIFEYSFLSIYIYICLLGFVVSFNYLFKSIYDTDIVFRYLVIIVSLLGLPTFFYWEQLYDFATLFLFTLGLGLMRNQKWFSFIVVYILSLFNKETTILLTLIFSIYFYGRIITRKKYISLLIGQVLLFLFIKLLLYLIYYNNPGSVVEFHLLSVNIKLLLDKYQLSVYLFTIFIMLILFYQWNAKPLFLRYSMVIIIPLFLLALPFGIIYEMRAFYEIYPIFILLIAHTFALTVNVKFSVIEEK